ncbi:pectin lyase-like protein [Coprinopsis marcescibilis]|uniref:galacturonan 1,4-alpha-galacturonidase n=1 Tax=Coprinopsis marcescibilis TaxID=230819 RepID=A0A5C3L8I9_COPMA|nr:pectin lyase-like protein [Coprinopsis marcescibilis]
MFNLRYPGGIWLILAGHILSQFTLALATDPQRCVIKRTEDPEVDDSTAILHTVKKCSRNSIIEFTPGNYSLFTPVSFLGLDNVTFLLNGNIILPSNITRVQVEINSTLNQPATYAIPWIYIQGTNVQVIGSESFEFGRFYSFGQQWWDLGIRTLRPHLATFNVTNGVLKNLKIIKPIAWGWSIPGQNIHISNHFVDAKPDNATRDDTISFPFNTDGFNLSGKNITVDGYYGHNGDDCVSVINGARDIVAKNGYCGFSSHGLSIGSLGRDGAVHTVENVLFKKWTMDGAVYGARFKSWTGGRGYGMNIAWEDITLVNVSTGVFITQNYYDQDKGPKPPNPSNSSTKIINIAFRNFKGGLGTSWTDGSCISDPCWNYVPGLDEPKAVILDLYPDTATNITLKEINIQPFNNPGGTPNVICDPAALSEAEESTLGFKCANGPFIPA